jgi:NAD-dependent deacetylase
METLLDLLDNTDKRVLFITGAGISVNSGIPPYRGSSDAVWSNFVQDFATRKKFLMDPLSWYNEFWLPTHYKTEYLKAETNCGHDALAYICKHYPNACVITQNVDGLHKGIDDKQLIEVHGNMHAGFKCVNSECSWKEKTIDINEVDLLYCAEKNSLSRDMHKFQLEKAPTCPQCNSAVLPQALLFDEEYSSHPFYEWDAASDWIEDAAGIVFIGTSLSVGLTKTALDASRKTPAAKLFNINITSMNNEIRQNDVSRMNDILGPSEQVLPLLAYVISESLGGRGGARIDSWNKFIPDHYILKRDDNGKLLKLKASIASVSTNKKRKRTSEIVASSSGGGGGGGGSSSSSSSSSSSGSGSNSNSNSNRSSRTFTSKSNISRKYRNRRKRKSVQNAGAVQQLYKMGFTNSEEVENALRKNYGNVEKALNSLIRQHALRETTITSIEMNSNTTIRKRGKTSRRKEHGLMLLMSKGSWLVEKK